MLAEEVYVDKSAQGINQAVTGPESQVEIETTPGLAHIAGDAGIHETAIKRDGDYFAESRLGIAPGAHMGFEKLQEKTGYVKNGNYFELVSGLESGAVHKKLD